MEPERARITIRHPFATFPRDVNCLGRLSSTFRDGAIRPYGSRSLSNAEPATSRMPDDLGPQIFRSLPQCYLRVMPNELF